MKDYFYLGCICVFQSLLNIKCTINKELIIEYLRAYKNIDEVSTEVKDVIDAVIKEHEDVKKDKDNLKKK